MDTIRTWLGLPEERSTSPLSLDDWLNYMSYAGNTYQIRQTLTGAEESIEGSFEGIVQGAYRDNGIVFACELARLMVFSEARFMFRQRRKGKPGDLFSLPSLDILDKPWRGARTGDLLMKMLQHGDIAGNAYVTRRQDRLKIMRPDWVTIVTGSDTDSEVSGDDLDAELVGYLYHPGGKYSGEDPVPLLPEQVAHFRPIDDPVANHLGIPWLTPVIREILSDKAATNHKQRFFENGATPNMVVSLDPQITEAQFKEWIRLFEANHKGTANAYKTLYLGGGAKVEVVGADLKQLDFKLTQGAGETRIAAAAGVPPIIVGLSEGLQSATYSNYGQAKRRFADGTMRPLWRKAAAALENIVPAPAASELWYDPSDIPFLEEDMKDAADILQTHAGAIRQLVDAGFEPQTVIDAVTAGDLERLQHTGLYSVQLQPPGTTNPEPEALPEQAGRSLAQLLATYERTTPDVG